MAVYRRQNRRNGRTVRSAYYCAEVKAGGKRWRLRTLTRCRAEAKFLAAVLKETLERELAHPDARSEAELIRLVTY